MNQHLTLKSEVTLWHDLSTESIDAKNVLDIISIPYTGIFSEPGANWYLPFIFIGNNSYRIKGLEEIKGFAIEEVKKNKLTFYSQIKIDSSYITSSKDIWMLESLFGEETVIEKLFDSQKIISDTFIKELFQNSQLKFFINTVRSILSSSNSELMENQFIGLKEIDVEEFINNFSIQQLEEAKEKGYVNIT